MFAGIGVAEWSIPAGPCTIRAVHSILRTASRGPELVSARATMQHHDNAWALRNTAVSGWWIENDERNNVFT